MDALPVSDWMHYLCQDWCTTCVRNDALPVFRQMHYLCQNGSTSCVRMDALNVPVLMHCLCQDWDTTYIRMDIGYTTCVRKDELQYLCQERLSRLANSMMMGKTSTALQNFLTWVCHSRNKFRMLTSFAHLIQACTYTYLKYGKIWARFFWALVMSSYIPKKVCKSKLWIILYFLKKGR